MGLIVVLGVGAGILLGVLAALWDLQHRVDQLIAVVTATQRTEEQIMATQAELDAAMTELKQAVADDTDAIHGMETVLDHNTARLDELIAGATNGTVAVADLQALRDTLASNKAEVLANVAKNTRLDTPTP